MNRPLASVIILLVAVSIPLCGQPDYPAVLRLKTECNKAYDAGDIQALASSLSEYLTEIKANRWASEAESLDYVRDAYKYLSELSYLKGDYKKSITYIDSALVCNGSRNNLRAGELYILKAQSQFMLRDYYGASMVLGKAYAQTRVNEALKYPSAISDIISAYALSLAYCGKFMDAEDKMKEALSITQYITNPDSIRELERRNNKIQLLKAECKDKPSPEDYAEVKKFYTEYFAERKIEISKEFPSMTPRQREGFWLTQRQFIVDCYRLGEYAPELVYDIALFNKNLLLQFSARNAEFRNYDWTDVKRGLPAKGAAIEFVQYRRDSSLYLAAVVIKKDSKAPKFIQIGQIDKILSHNLQNGMTVKAATAADSHNSKRALYSKDSGLPTLLWTPELTEKLEGCDNVYFSADGFLHQIAIEYLYPGEDAPTFHRLTSTRSVCKGCKPVSVSDASALICGAMDFQADIRDEDNLQNDSTAFEGIAGKGLYFKNLEWSKREIDSIAVARSCPDDSILRGQMATEQAFRGAAGEYRLVHISSHGWFNGHLNVPVEELRPHKTDNTLSQSVIFFSGANANLNDSSFDPAGHSDGLLSAREISDLDLSNVDLCVLAACQTGLGDVTADGVYGIQRGLKNAGAGAMLLSLWSVDDKATSILMAALYRHIAKGEKINTAFRHAREELSQRCETIYKYSAARMTHKRIDKNGIYNDPYYTNAFILIDDIR